MFVSVSFSSITCIRVLCSEWRVRVGLRLGLWFSPAICLGVIEKMYMTGKLGKFNGIQGIENLGDICPKYLFYDLLLEIVKG